MHGVVHLTVQSARLKYELDFIRNITILKGKSATGKTSLVDMIREYELNGADTGINLGCSCPCRVLEGVAWMEQLERIHNSLVFIDEGNRFVASEDFARRVRGSDNYYVIITRESLSNLPYSVTEIYGIRSTGKYAFQEPVYHQMYRIYGDYRVINIHKPDVLLTEDSNAGFDFFTGISSSINIKCISAHGAGNIFSILQEADESKNITVIADGAAFGPQMEKVYQVLMRKTGISLYLPESFEWLILSSGVLRDSEVQNILENPADHIRSEDYFSWERYFTQLLVSKTADSYLKYSKEALNPAFLQGKICSQIVAALPEMLRLR